MFYLDLDEIDEVLSRSRLLGKTIFHLARYKREDFYGSEQQSISENVRQRVQQELGFCPDGPVRLLANIRYFGYVTNPISCYYCFDQHERLVAMLLEVTNTPWHEKEAYALDFRRASTKVNNVSFAKTMHVSPFMPMNMRYQWRGSTPGNKLTFTLSNWLDADAEEKQDNDSDTKTKTGQSDTSGELYFKAGVDFSRKEISASTVRSTLLRYPFMTGKVIVGIYWQALKLLVKKVGVYRHPDNVSKIKIEQELS